MWKWTAGWSENASAQAGRHAQTDGQSENIAPPATCRMNVKKGKVFPYSLPSVGPGADPGVQAVSPQVT